MKTFNFFEYKYMNFISLYQFKFDTYIIYYVGVLVIVFLERWFEIIVIVFDFCIISRPKSLSTILF